MTVVIKFKYEALCSDCSELGIFIMGMILRAL